jgi:biotin operon repressor
MDDRTKIIENERPLFQFFGPDVSQEDFVRLKSQLLKVKTLMFDEQWRTLPEIAKAVKGSEPSVSARLRQLRSQGYQVDRRRVKDGVFEYRVHSDKAVGSAV